MHLCSAYISLIDPGDSVICNTPTPIPNVMAVNDAENADGSLFVIYCIGNFMRMEDRVDEIRLTDDFC